VRIIIRSKFHRANSAASHGIGKILLLWECH
jgi:hypothetical protein